MHDSAVWTKAHPRSNCDSKKKEEAERVPLSQRPFDDTRRSAVGAHLCERESSCV